MKMFGNKEHIFIWIVFGKNTSKYQNEKTGP